MKNKIQSIGLLLVVLLWACLALWAWTKPAGDISGSERRPLAQFPELSIRTLLNGSFMEKFEDYTLDQFPLRDSFRTLNSLFRYHVLQQQDSNGIYLADGFAVKQEYPLNSGSIDHALSRFDRLYDKYLSAMSGNIAMAVVPDKGYYLAEEAGQLQMDYDAFFNRFRTEMPWAEHVDLTGSLSADDYYRTDIHWRQENLLPAAQAICESLGVTGPAAEDFTATALERPFYGVYYGQAALPMDPDTLYLMENDLLRDCSVYDHESGKTGSVYDLQKLESRDLYDVFLSGPRSLLTVENPHGQPGKELIVFRDSFGSSIVPLILADYSRVTLVDIRYIQPDLLDRFVEFGNQDVLLLYSVSVLNNSSTLK